MHRRLLALTVVLLPACGSPAVSPSGGTPAPQSRPASTPQPGLAIAAKGAAGRVVVDERGFTLYYFTPDAAAATPACTGACAGTWPPLVVPRGERPRVGAGITGAVSSVARADGSVQVTYKGWPLYSYTKDKEADDAYGQGVGGKWFMATAAISRPASAPALTPAGAA